MWWIILIVIALVIIAFLKFEHYKKAIHIFILMIILVIVFFSMNAMMKSGEMDFTSPGATINSFAVYFTWLGETGLQLFGIGRDTVRTVGNVIMTNETKTN